VSNRHYITTAIDFPNAAPHMGHVYEKILADVCARWRRLKGDDVRFHLGTDENGIKIQQTAAGLGITPRELVDLNAPVFESLFRRLDVSFDYFIRTADPASHWPTVTALWNRLKEGGWLEKRTYEGLYCTGCERFLTHKDLVDGKCPDHDRAPEKVTEENWFFRLSARQDDVKKLLDPMTGTYRLLPERRAGEVRAFLEQGLEDVSFSRSKKTLTWGVPVPEDPDQVMYVWCDNLTSYISSLGYLTDKPMTEYWDGAEVTHVIGKDIARFHALNWPAMLQCAGLKTPDRLLVHGFITSRGQKMSKSLGNVVDPEEVLAKYGVDALRFYLMREVHVGSDGDFTWEQIDGIYNGTLRNQLGNLLNRVLVMLRKEGGALTVPSTPQILDAWRERDAWRRYAESMDAWELRGVDVAVELVQWGNKLMDDHKPWTLPTEEKLVVLGQLAELLRHLTLMLLPFMPGAAARMATQLGLPEAERMAAREFTLTDALREWGAEKDWVSIGEPSILFPPLDEKAAA
jgi:methionyl-tRNA synthetase